MNVTSENLKNKSSRWMKILLIGIVSFILIRTLIPRIGGSPGWVNQDPPEFSDTTTNPNFVSSKSEISERYVEPILLPEDIDPDSAFKLISDLAEKQKGWKLVNSGDQWAHFECSTQWMNFVDDLAIKLNFKEEKQWFIDIKSASRLGYSDLETNRKRIENFKELIRKQPGFSSLVSPENKSKAEEAISE
jgi:uncharacterized protein (DUF1499 family)